MQPLGISMGTLLDIEHASGAFVTLDGGNGLITSLCITKIIPRSTVNFSAPSFRHNM